MCEESLRIYKEEWDKNNKNKDSRLNKENTLGTSINMYQNI